MMIVDLKRKFHNLVSDKKFSEILTGSIWAVVARVVGAGLAMVSSIIVARYYGADMVGVLAMVQAFMMMASIFAVLGTDVSILRLVPEHLAKYSVTSAFRVYRKTQCFVAVVSLLVGGLFFLASAWVAQKVFSKPNFSFYIALASTCIIFKALTDLNTAAVRGLRLIKAFAFMQVLPHLAMLTILLGMMVFSKQTNDPVYAQLASWGVAALLGAFIMDRAFHLRLHSKDVVSSMALRQILSLSTPMLMTASMNFIIGQMGVLILGMYRSASEVGYYAIAVKLATLTSFVLNAINSMAAPKFSELFHAGKMDDLFYVARKSTKLIFWTTTPVLFFLVVLGRPVLTLFGKDFTAAYVAMLILVLGQFVNAVSGSTGYFMNMTGHQGVFRNIIAFASIVYLGIGFALIPRFGLNGAAVAGTVSLSVWNLWTLFYIKRKYGRTIGYVPF